MSMEWIGVTALTFIIIGIAFGGKFLSESSRY